MRPIKVRQNGDSCLLRWSYEGDTYSLTWGKWTDAVDKAKMEYIARLVYQDSLSGNFDTTLHKYKSWLEGLSYTGNGNGSNGNSTPKPKQPPLLKLLEQRLIEHYSAADYSLLGNLKKFKEEIRTPAQAKEFMKWLDDKGLKVSSQKRYLTILKVLRRDLFETIELRVGEKPRPKPFSVNEVNRILDYLYNDPHYSHYYDFVLFLLNSGLRISEAIGMRWQDIDLDKREIHVYEVLNRDKGNSSKRKRQTTKTTKYRVVPINNKLYQSLCNRSKGNPEDLVFTTPTGLELDDHNLSQRMWKKTLEKLGIPHRPLYNCRSTFISHCISSGIPPHDVAAIVGNSPDVIFKHYLGSIKKPVLPEL
ncbi:integrase/site-specific recombinase [Nostoc sp. 'Peltigera membranacea cyanobiont' N6]|nr:integrase/site-specific recombinase [Nostoc sp. 'Peltigera membranacea cyanobiont' N6]